ncbi:right-handed parallel beta-helix repeat-containing protein [Salinispora fenicalii]|uniref:membrane protein n=1 Tax=Salinispora fenicalii TaxID=1137263 RepID=UPI0004AF3981|nr:membrane protein [Salinispora fenicalii]
MINPHQKPDQSGVRRTRSRWWSAGLAGVTGLALTTVGIAATPAAGRSLPVPDDLPSTDRHHADRGSRGAPVPCDADALIAAITLANARGGATLDLATDCTYLLTADIDGAGLPAIATPITLNGNKHTTIERAAATDQFRILTVNTGGNLTLNKLTITGGHTPDDGDGGAVLVDAGGTLTTNHSTITRNIAENDGGAIANNGTTRVKQSTIERNAASGVGGGIVSAGLLDVNKSRLNANTAFVGAGVSSVGTAHIEHSGITANHAAGSVGGLLMSGGTVTNTKITDNTALEVGGVLANTDTQLTLTSVTLAGNTATGGRGGGLAINSGASVVIAESVVANNTADRDGGGIYNLAEIVVRNTKVTGNQSGDQGGGIYSDESATLFDTKVVKNIAITEGGGIFNEGGGTVELNTATGTIVIKNRPDNCVNVPGCAG